MNISPINDIANASENAQLKDSYTLPQVEIRSKGPNSCCTDLYINGTKIPGVLSFSVEHDPMKEHGPILTLKTYCNVDISGGMIPFLPAPWSLFYELKDEFKNVRDLSID